MQLLEFSSLPPQAQLFTCLCECLLIMAWKNLCLFLFFGRIEYSTTVIDVPAFRFNHFPCCPSLPPHTHTRLASLAKSPSNPPAFPGGSITSMQSNSDLSITLRHKTIISITKSTYLAGWPRLYGKPGSTPKGRENEKQQR